MGFGGGGGKPDIPAPAKRAPTKVEPNLDEARAKSDIKKRQRRSLATQRPMLSEAKVKQTTLGA